MKTQQPKFWGKATKDGSRWHALQHHCLDVAAVAVTLFDSDPILKKRLVDSSPLNEEQTRSVIQLFAALHDIGKFGLDFQYYLPELCKANGLPDHQPEGHHHTLLGFGFWESGVGEIVADALGIDDYDDLEPLAVAAFGHHGLPVFNDVQERWVRPVRENGIIFAEELTSSFELAALPDELIDNDLLLFSWLLAGLFVLADWIGSNDEWVEYDSEWQGVEPYFGKQSAKAVAILEQCGILSPQSVDSYGFDALVPGGKPRPLQQYVLDLSKQASPELIIIEDVTGGGKTEAALLAAYRAMKAGFASGFYVGLPTMATANAMYGRLGESYRKMFESAPVSLRLAHGGVVLNDDYLASIGMPNGEREMAGGDFQTPICTAWLADNRKKALLAPCGVGTLDQALLGALPSKHQALRLIGLARSVLIGDEVHSYDEYTGRVLEELLTFHASFGGSAVLLSATMKSDLRRKLVTAWKKGRKLAGASSLNDNSDSYNDIFPLITRVTDKCVHCDPIDASRHFSVEVEFVSSEDEMIARLEQAHEAGACVCWVRNTVADAVSAYERIRELGIPEADCLLFHARFTGYDRMHLESKVLEWAGKNSTEEQRAGKVILATQVVEQSLDVDFDCVFSDLAPMELLIQRAGRGHRHERKRKDGYATPRIVVLSPEPVADPEASWFADAFPIGQWVYPDPALLWRTARELHRRGGFTMPDDARQLMEAAYEGPVPESMESKAQDVEGQAFAKRGTGSFSVLDCERGYCLTNQNAAWDQDVRTPTRLGEDTVQVRLVCVEPEGLRLWAAKSTCQVSMKDCIRSEVRIRATQLHEAVVPEKIQDDLEDFIEKMPDKGKWCVVLPVTQDTESVWNGVGINQKGGTDYISYDSRRGFSWNE